MKLFLLVFLFSSIGLADSYDFHYSFQNNSKVQNFIYRVEADNYEAAFDAASDFCYDFLSSKNKQDEDTLLRIIDTCANPR
jgi:hypothetical protein